VVLVDKRFLFEIVLRSLVAEEPDDALDLDHLGVHGTRALLALARRQRAGLSAALDLGLELGDALRVAFEDARDLRLRRPYECFERADLFARRLDDLGAVDAERTECGLDDLANLRPFARQALQEPFGARDAIELIAAELGSLVNAPDVDARP